MKLFLRKLIIFFLPVIIGLFFMEFTLRVIPNDYKYKKEQLLKELDSIKILVLGSSHAHYGINPDYFFLNGYNFSNISQSPDLDYELLKKYGSELKNMEYVIMPVSYFSLFSSLSAGAEDWRIKNYILYYGIIPDKSSLSIKNLFELTNGTILSNIKRIYQFYKKKTNLITVSDRGFGMNYNSSIKNDMEETGKAAALRHTKTDMKFFDYNKSIIEKIIEWCKNRNINLIFITLPAFYTYRERLNENQLNVIINYMNSIANNDGVYYYNLLDEDSFLEDDFFDADHLNEIGAKKLTKKINDIIDNINQ
jgi:hypothetical protein